MQISNNLPYWRFCDALCDEFYEKYGRAAQLFLDSQFLERSFMPYLVFTHRYNEWYLFKKSIKNLYAHISNCGWTHRSSIWKKKYKKGEKVHPFDWKRTDYLSYVLQYFPTFGEVLADYWFFVGNNVDYL